MQNPHIPLPQLALTLIPILGVFFFYARWGLRLSEVGVASGRMLVQLATAGYFLNYLFGAPSPLVALLVLLFMLVAAAWISLHFVKRGQKRDYGLAFLALAAGCLPVLALTIFGVLRVEPWYEPSYVIPLGGIIIANAMNAVSLAAERFPKELGKGVAHAKKQAYRTALIPITNSFLAVGLVSLPGMMTGQILAGVHPLVAVRYQIVVMTTIYGAAGMAAGVYLSLLARR